MTQTDAGFNRKPTLAQARALADERALSDALAEGLRKTLRALAGIDAPPPNRRTSPAVTAARAVLARYAAARGAR